MSARNNSRTPVSRNDRSPSERSRDYPDRPIVGVAAVVWRDERVLLIRRGKPPRRGQWSLPGGVQKVGETVAETARRELLEETGLAIEVLGLVDVVDSIERDADGKVRRHYTLIELLAGCPEGEPAAGDDADAVAWVPMADIAGLGMWSETERVIRLALEMWRARAPGRQARP